MSASTSDVNEVAKAIVTGCDPEAAKQLHVELCAFLNERKASTFDGIMALLWTAIDATKEMAQRNDGATLSRGDAERVLIAIMDGPEPTLEIVRTPTGVLQ